MTFFVNLSDAICFVVLVSIVILLIWMKLTFPTTLYLMSKLGIRDEGRRGYFILAPIGIFYATLLAAASWYVYRLF